MSLIETSQLLQRFSERLAQAVQVDIAVAWAKPCDALEALAESVNEGTTIRIAVGVSGNVTDPTTLERLHKFVDLRIAPSPQYRIFHPKFFCFHGPDRTICWVGSTNLTRGGFGGNAELVHEFDDSAGEGRHWFESLWNTLDSDPGPAIAEYNDRYQPQKPVPRPHPTGGAPELVPLANQSTWDDFVEGLRARDDYWSWRSQDENFPWDVLGDTQSWIHTISTGREVVRLPDWVNLTQRECFILRGRDREEGTWGLLGTLEPVGRFKQVFNPRNMPDVGPVRTQLRHLIGQVLNASSSEIAHYAHNALHEIKRLGRFGPAVATRLLTLARPDCLVSVNGQSAAGLGALSGLPKTRDSLADNYVELLNWVYEQPWFNARQPDDPLERTIWNSRAALLDAFVHEGING